MLCRVLSVCVFLTFMLPFVMAHWKHKEVARRARGDVNIHKRQYFGYARFTWYDVGMGACGQWNNPGDFIVALNVGQYGSGYPGPQCFKSITIQYGGKTAGATIMDECMGCPMGGLDFSKGLFEYFAPFGDGVLYGAWWYNDGPQTSTTAWEQPTTTSTPAYIPLPTTSSTTVYVPSPTTSSTLATPSRVNSTTTTSLATSTSSINLNTGWASGLAVPTGSVSTPNASNPENILVLYNLMVEFGTLLTVAEKCG